MITLNDFKSYHWYFIRDEDKVHHCSSSGGVSSGNSTVEFIGKSLGYAQASCLLGYRLQPPKRKPTRQPSRWRFRQPNLQSGLHPEPNNHWQQIHRSWQHDPQNSFFMFLQQRCERIQRNPKLQEINLKQHQCAHWYVHGSLPGIFLCVKKLQKCGAINHPKSDVHDPSQRLMWGISPSRRLL